MTTEKLYTQAEVDAIKRAFAAELLARVMVSVERRRIVAASARRQAARRKPDMTDRVLNVLTFGVWGDGI